MTMFSYRIRAKRPSWDDFDIANASLNTYTTVTSVRGNDLKVFASTAIIHTFNLTMCDIKKLLGTNLNISSMIIYSSNNIADKYKIDYGANPELAYSASCFICFDYDGLAYALGLNIDTCGG